MDGERIQFLRMMSVVEFSTMCVFDSSLLCLALFSPQGRTRSVSFNESQKNVAASLAALLVYSKR